ncbi:MAG: hypothetical protein AB7T07_05450 [Steroidobacteraceae bacterium]
MPLRRHASYRLEGDQYLIEIKLREMRQLFNNLDPAPFHEKDLDASAEEYIVSAVRELGIRQRNKLVIYLPATPDAEAGAIPAAIHHYFDYRARQTGNELQQLLRFGAISLLIGLAFLCLCLLLRELLTGRTASQIVTEGLLIVGWVALWRPLEVFLYEWWPIRRRQLGFMYIAGMPVEVRRAD